MRRLLVAGALALAVLISGCGPKLPDQLSLPTELTGGEPQTLETATAAAQEIADRRTSGDFAGVWLMLTKQQRDAISQADYVTLQNACARTGLPAHVTGVRLDNSTTAIVRWNIDIPNLSGVKVTKTMLYEDGKWLLAPDPEFVWDHGLPVQQIIANRQASGDCEKTASASAIPTATSAVSPPPSGTTTQPQLRTSSTSDATAAGNGGTAHLSNVRMAPQDGYDRLVLEFTDQLPDYTIGYRPLPAKADGSGDEIPLPGASALLQITLKPAVADWDYSNHDYQGPETITSKTAVVTEATMAGDIEAVLTWVVGLRARVPFRVDAVDDPPTLIVDFEH
ncbi:hypothetical protein AB0K11_08660 [Mycobacterium sp. NPDC050551]|uniref:AMIN-like domain-containing (lipo)protein n=1 Tax=Mycobacterium sp. NPDC050551 TaxID=3155407 RepID=UPI00343F7B4F